LARPLRIALMASTVSTPCSRGLTIPNRESNAAKNFSGIFSQMPIVRSPRTLKWPRTGQRPAPGLPIMPRTNSTLAISKIVGTASAAAVRTAPIDSRPCCSDTITAFTPAASCSAPVTATARSS
jgi:hypothetical protein